MKLRKDRNLAEGEVTGHAHRATAENCKVYGEDERFIECPSGTEIIHEEHGTRNLPPGDYDIRIQKEIDPDTEEIQRVKD